MDDLNDNDLARVCELAAVYTTPAFLASVLQMGRDETAALIGGVDEVVLTPEKLVRLRALIARFDASTGSPGWRCIQLRTLAGLSAVQLARAAGVSWLRVSSLEAGRHVSLATLDAVAGALSTQRGMSWVRVDDLLHAELPALREKHAREVDRLDRGAARRRRQEKHDPLA